MKNQSIFQRLRGKIKFFPSLLFMKAKDAKFYVPVEPIIPDLKSGVLYIRNDSSSGYTMYWIVEGSWYFIKQTHSNVASLLNSKCGIFKNYTEKEYNSLANNYSSLSHKQRDDLFNYACYHSMLKVRSNKHRQYLKLKRTWGI